MTLNKSAKLAPPNNTSSFRVVDSVNSLSEDEVVQIIDKIAKRLAARFKFGYHEVKDIEQQARLLALEGMQKYDGVRPLENYLWVHVRNRLFNFKRDNYFRPYGPCEKCDKYNKSNNLCDDYQELCECELYQQWQIKNMAKLNLIYPIEFSCVDDYNEGNMHDTILTEDCVLNNELKIILDKHIPIEYRHHYLRLLYGYSVQQQYKLIVIALIRDIIDEHYTMVDLDE